MTLFDAVQTKNVVFSLILDYFFDGVLGEIQGEMTTKDKSFD